jgi:RNA 3'-terminal phosphate cyclase (ATP)
MTGAWLEIDGSSGEGGGQILRTALGLSLCTGRPVRFTRIRAGRSRPGLMRQHLTAVQAAATIGEAEVTGDAVGSQEVTFKPRGLRTGAFRFSVGTAGSTTLVLQTVLPALLLAPGPTEIVLEGGTHNPSAPPFDFLERAFLPLVDRMGPRVKAVLERPGFYPAGGGRLRVTVTPAPGRALEPIRLERRGELRQLRAVARVAAIPATVGHRELAQIKKSLGLGREDLECEELDARLGPGNVVFVEAVAAEVTEVFTGFGQKGVRAETVARAVAREARRWVDAGVPVGEHLADQLIPLVALAGAGRFCTLPLSRHARTQLDLVGRFLDARIDVSEEAPDRWLVACGG